MHRPRLSTPQQEIGSSGACLYSCAQEGWTQGDWKFKVSMSYNKVFEAGLGYIGHSRKKVPDKMA